MERSDRKPAVQVEGEVWIGAPPSRVWEVLTDLERWNRWHRGISFAQLRGSVERGTIFHWRKDGMHVVSALDPVEPERTFGWHGRAFGARLRHLWTLEPSQGGTRVRGTESVDGFMVWVIRRSVRKTVDRSLAEWLHGLKARAEAPKEDR